MAEVAPSPVGGLVESQLLRGSCSPQLGLQKTLFQAAEPTLSHDDALLLSPLLRGSRHSPPEKGPGPESSIALQAATQAPRVWLVQSHAWETGATSAVSTHGEAHCPHSGT